MFHNNFDFQIFYVERVRRTFRASLANENSLHISFSVQYCLDMVKRYIDKKKYILYLYE